MFKKKNRKKNDLLNNTLVNKELSKSVILDSYLKTRTALIAGADPNTKTSEGNPLLHEAICLKVENKIIQDLVEFGANVNATNKDGETIFDLPKFYKLPPFVVKQIVEKVKADNQALTDNSWTFFYIIVVLLGFSGISLLFCWIMRL